MWFVSDKIQIADSELEFSYARSSGPGGQNVNKVNSKALLRWRPDNLPHDIKWRFLQKFGYKLSTEGDLLITSDRYRDRLRNQEDCLEKLKQMLLEVENPPKPRKKTKPTRASKIKRTTSKRLHGEKKRLRKVSYD